MNVNMNDAQKMINEILVRNGYVHTKMDTFYPDDVNKQFLGTILSNMAYYGFIPSNMVLQHLFHMTDETLLEFWNEYKDTFALVTGDDRQMGDYVVYKNFPTEVLNMSEGEYWIKQILMYWGMPNVYFTEEERSRPSLTENKALRVLHIASDTALRDIYVGLCNSPYRWTEFDQKGALFLDYSFSEFKDITSFGFKENAINMFIDRINSGRYENIGQINDATDVLRLAAGINGSDVSLRTDIRWNNFSRKRRKQFLHMLEGSKHIDEDIAMRPETWKRFLYMLHVGDYKNRFPKVKSAYDKLYNDSFQSYNKIVDGQRSSRKDIIKALKTRPGDFLRRFHSLYGRYGAKLLDDVSRALQGVSVRQLVSFKKYIETVNDRETFIVAPKGNWSRARVLENVKRKIDNNTIEMLSNVIDRIITDRLSDLGKINLDERLKNVKLPTNDQEVSEYSRGTIIDIPENITFIRSASFWEHKVEHRNVWFDNGWNFFDSEWKAKGVICWNSTHMMDDCAVFSGDPTNSKDLEGKACQMIDLYIDKLVASGIRYGVWNILAYSGIPFSGAKDVLGTLQYGEDALVGKLYEPSRAEIVFPIKGNNYTKYLAYVDFVERKIVYLDANLAGDIQSAVNNSKMLMGMIPTYLEYLDSLPSVYDLFNCVKTDSDKVTDVLYSDMDEAIVGTAYVYKTENTDSNFTQLNLNDILKMKE